MRNRQTDDGATAETTQRAPDSWVRAVGLSVLTLLLLIVAFFYVPQWILTKLASPPRGVRVWMASGWMAFAFAVACYSAWRSSPAPSRTD